MTTINTLFKAHVEVMPEVLNTKKDVDEYCKQFWKEQKEKIKEAKAAEKAANAADAKNPKKNKKVDKDGNVKEKRAPSAYNLFVKEKYAEIKEGNPEMDKTKIFEELARLWNIHKQEKKDAAEPVAQPVAEPVAEPVAQPVAEIKASEDFSEIEEVKDEEKSKKKSARKSIKKKETPLPEANNEDDE